MSAPQGSNICASRSVHAAIGNNKCPNTISRLSAQRAWPHTGHIHNISPSQVQLSHKKASSQPKVAGTLRKQRNAKILTHRALDLGEPNELDGPSRPSRREVRTILGLFICLAFALQGFLTRRSCVVVHNARRILERSLYCTDRVCCFSCVCGPNLGAMAGRNTSTCLLISCIGITHKDIDKCTHMSPTPPGLLYALSLRSKQQCVVWCLTYHMICKLHRPQGFGL